MTPIINDYTDALGRPLTADEKATLATLIEAHFTGADITEDWRHHAYHAAERGMVKGHWDWSRNVVHVWNAMVTDALTDALKS